jgi:hypothetical protein
MQIIAGVRVGHWRILSVTGRQTTCQCACHVVCVVAIAALKDGTSTSCGCMPLTPQQRERVRAERTDVRDWFDWRPARGR